MLGVVDYSSSSSSEDEIEADGRGKLSNDQASIRFRETLLQDLGTLHQDGKNSIKNLFPIASDDDDDDDDDDENDDGSDDDSSAAGSDTDARPPIPRLDFSLLPKPKHNSKSSSGKRRRKKERKAPDTKDTKDKKRKEKKQKMKKKDKRKRPSSSLSSSSSSSDSDYSEVQDGTVTILNAGDTTEERKTKKLRFQVQEMDYHDLGDVDQGPMLPPELQQEQHHPSDLYAVSSGHHSLPSVPSSGSGSISNHDASFQNHHPHHHHHYHHHPQQQYHPQHQHQQQMTITDPSIASTADEGSQTLPSDIPEEILQKSGGKFARELQELLQREGSAGLRQIDQNHQLELNEAEKAILREEKELLEKLDPTGSRRQQVVAGGGQSMKSASRIAKSRNQIGILASHAQGLELELLRQRRRREKLRSITRSRYGF